jgi:Zinc-uptake complex component A periplasmic
VRAALIVGATAALAAGCGNGDETAHPGQVKVVATTTQIADFARAVGGDRAVVVGLLKPNTDPHEYEPRPSDVVRAPAQMSSSRTATTWTVGWATWSSRPAGVRRWLIWALVCR